METPQEAPEVVEIGARQAAFQLQAGLLHEHVGALVAPAQHQMMV